MVYGTECAVSIWPVRVCASLWLNNSYYHSCRNSPLPYNKLKLVVQSTHFSEAEIHYPFFFCPDFFLSTLLNFNSSNNHLSLAPNRQSNAYFLKRDHNSQSINLGDPTFSNTVHLKASKTLKRAKLCYQRSSSFLKY